MRPAADKRSLLVGGAVAGLRKVNLLRLGVLAMLNTGSITFAFCSGHDMYC